MKSNTERIRPGEVFLLRNLVNVTFHVFANFT